MKLMVGRQQLLFQGRMDRVLKVECVLTLAIWSYGYEAEEHIFLNFRFLQTIRKILQFAVF